ncbi:MAG TPA: hypothetical protein PKO06_12355 [Candidatus Ozemobacteraceae bacterium]|nr:hypothetical protein [Candidatus Ozemobacteraceae bacterium]
MQRSLSQLLIIALVLGIGFAIPGTGHAAPGDPQKIVPGMPFHFFDLEDLNRQRWVSTYLRGRPVILITGHRDQKYDMLKWADALKREFADPGMAHVLWVMNFRKLSSGTSRKTVTDMWRAFAPPVPMLLDWHGVVGRGLKINYGVPNVIAIDAWGRLAFHEMHSFTPEVYAAVSSYIRPLLVGNPDFPKAAIETPIEGKMLDNQLPYGATPKGKKGYSY